MAARRRREPAVTAEARRVFLATIRDAWSVTEAASRASTTRARFYELRDRDPQFAIDWQEADQCALDLIRDTVRRRAIDGVPSFQLDKDGKEHPTRIFSDRLLEVAARRLPELRERQPLELNVRGALELGVTVEHDYAAILAGLQEVGLLIPGPAVDGVLRELEAGPAPEPDGGEA